MASGPGSVPAVGGGCGKGESPGPGTPCFYLRSQQPYPPPPLPSRCPSHGRELRECPGVCGLGGLDPRLCWQRGGAGAWLRAPVSRRKWVFRGAGVFWAVVSGFIQPSPMLSSLPHWFPLPFCLSIPLNVFLLLLCSSLPLALFPVSLGPFFSLILLLWVLVMFSPQLTHLSLSSASLIHSGCCRMSPTRPRCLRASEWAPC